VLAAAETAELVPRFLNLGGAWHGIPDLGGALAEVRAAVPAGIELIIEPGRRATDEAGFACGRVVRRARARGPARLCVIDLSRICTCGGARSSWSCGTARGRRTQRAGRRPDLLRGGRDRRVDDRPARLAAGAPIVFRHVTGYAVAWNTSFGGVPAAGRGHRLSRPAGRVASAAPSRRRNLVAGRAAVLAPRRGVSRLLWLPLVLAACTAAPGDEVDEGGASDGKGDRAGGSRFDEVDPAHSTVTFRRYVGQALDCSPRTTPSSRS